MKMKHLCLYNPFMCTILTTKDTLIVPFLMGMWKGCTLSIRIIAENGDLILIGTHTLRKEPFWLIKKAQRKINICRSIL